MDTNTALTFAIERLERTQHMLERALNDPRRPREQTAADIETYAAALETLTALREHIADTYGAHTGDCDDASCGACYEATRP